MSEKNIVLPGDKLSTSEEFSTGEGTFEERGVIRASRLGVYKIDKKNKKASVEPLTSIPVELKKGDTVLAEVNSVRSSMVIAEVIHVIGKDREVSGDVNGTLRVSEISHSYTKEPSDEYAPGDILRAKVIQVKPSVQLATKDKNLGVIKAVCRKCRHPLVRKGKILECENCGNKEKRTIAFDYGNYELTKL